MDLAGQGAIVTGGGQGIGRGIVLALAGRGADVAIFEINRQAAWYYADPKLEAAAIRGRVAFWKGVRVEP